MVATIVGSDSHVKCSLSMAYVVLGRISGSSSSSAAFRPYLADSVPALVSSVPKNSRSGCSPNLNEVVYSLALEGYVQEPKMPAGSILSVRMGAGSSTTYPPRAGKPFTQALSRVDDNALIREAQR